MRKRAFVVLAAMAVLVGCGGESGDEGVEGGYEGARPFGLDEAPVVTASHETVAPKGVVTLTATKEGASSFRWQTWVRTADHAQEVTGLVAPDGAAEVELTAPEGTKAILVLCAALDASGTPGPNAWIEIHVVE